MIQLETWKQFHPDCLPLFLEHENEIGEKRHPLDPDIDLIEKMDAMNLVQIVTAREEGQLVGYCIFTLGNSLMSRRVLIGTQGPVFVTKSKRRGGLGIRLYEFAFSEMIKKGVQDIYPHYWVQGGEVLRNYFERKGAVELERVYSLRGAV